LERLGQPHETRLT